ncbi:hypothetical protein TNCV_2364521 [Trichonephila clavipes]|nr:hypothetical protein TNCV_2364521 [Trichonephila clavipes]
MRPADRKLSIAALWSRLENDLTDCCTLEFHTYSEVEVEAAINNRHLVYEEGIGDTEEALTPGNFLTGQKLTKFPSCPEPKERRLTRFFEQQQEDLLK